MNTCSTTLLCNTNNHELEFLARLHHKVRHLIYYDHNVWHLAFVMFLHIAIFVRNLNRTTILRHLSVIVDDILNTFLCHHGITTLHLVHCPLQGAKRLRNIRNNWGKQMRNIFIGSHFDLLRIDNNQAKVGWRVMVKHRAQQSISHDGLTRTGSTRNEKVRHLCEVADNGLTRNIFAKRKTKRLIRDHLRPLRRLQKLVQTNATLLLVLDFNTDGARARNWRLDANLTLSKVQGKLLIVSSNLRNLNACRRTKRILRNARANICLFDIDINIKLAQSILDNMRNLVRITRICRRTLLV